AVLADGPRPAFQTVRGLALRSPCGEEVANLLEQYFAPWWRRRCRFFAHVQTRQHLDHPEDREADDHELDHSVEENAEVQGHRTGLLRVDERRRRWSFQRHKDVGEVDAADEKADDRREDVLHQAVHHRGEINADNDAYGEVDDIAAHDEGAKLLDPSRTPKAYR